MHILRIAACLTAIAAAAGCGAETEPPDFRPVASVEELMYGMINPLAGVVFSSVGTVITLEGAEDFMPASDAEWERVADTAMALAESGNLLMLESRAKDNGDWMDISRAFIDRSVAAAEAARAQDFFRLLMAGGEIYETCLACHEQYNPQPLIGELAPGKGATPMLALRSAGALQLARGEGSGHVWRQPVHQP